MNILDSAYNELRDHARREAPIEACGYLAGQGDTVTHYFPMTNVDHSPEHFSFDPKEQFAVIKAARNEGLTLLGNFHSHPETPARPSEEDIRLAYDPDITYVIGSLATAEFTVRAFQIQNGTATPVPLEVTPC